MAKPKLALIPAAQGTSLYSVLPSSGVGDFTFSRGSSATRINAQGLIETVASGVSRLNYPLIDGVVNGCPSHLLEPNATNLVVYSEDFSDASWAKQIGGVASAPLVTSNYAISPDGTQNASRVVFDLNGGTTSSDFSQLQTNITGTTGVDYASSVYMKSNDSNTYDVTFIDVAGTTTIVSVTPQWKRFDLTAALASTNMRIRTRGSEGSSNVTDISIWGAQIEEQSYATSYIPTSGSAVTRSAETAIGSGDASTFNSSEGVLFAEISAFANDGTTRSIAITDGTVNNIITIRYWAFAGDATLQCIYVDGAGGTYVNDIFLPNLTDFAKIALSYQQGALNLYVNGTLERSVALVVNDTINWNTLQFNIGNGSQVFYGNVRQIQYYDSALNDSDLETLTSWTSFTDLANGQQYSIK